jgi:NDP-4-keto-2,6-dideoxyhexose 3-C-methyltransferase
MRCDVIRSDRAGGEGELIPIMDLGDIFLNDYPDPDESDVDFPKAPITVVWNADSKLLQNLQTVDRSSLYSKYWYVSGINSTMCEHLKYVANLAVKHAGGVSPHDVVLDIASNDGTLLRQYPALGHQHVVTVGYDPALNLQDEARRGVSEHFACCFDAEHYHTYVQRPAKIITACAVVYHMPYPIKFLQDVAECLADDGVFVCEFTYLPSMMKNNAFDSIGHEHLTHLSLMSFERMLGRAGLEITHVEMGSSNAGTLLCVIKKAPVVKFDIFSRAYLEGLRAYEEYLGLDEVDIYKEFASRGYAIRERLRVFLNECLEAGKPVYAYGASTKGSILLQWAQVGFPLISRAVERNPSKVGRKMVGTGIKIISEEQARKDNPDYMLVLPWHFRDEFVTRERDYLENGGKLVFPLPEFEIIGAT